MQVTKEYHEQEKCLAKRRSLQYALKLSQYGEISKSDMNIIDINFQDGGNREEVDATSESPVRLQN